MRRVRFREDTADVALTSRLELAQRLKAIKTTSVAGVSVLRTARRFEYVFCTNTEMTGQVSETSCCFGFMLLLAQGNFI